MVFLIVFIILGIIVGAIMCIIGYLAIDQDTDDKDNLIRMIKDAGYRK